MRQARKFLIIQTASLGDVILSTALAETLNANVEGAEIHYLVKKGYESLFRGHPFVKNVLFWDKSTGKYAGMWRLIREIRKNRYDVVVNVQRFASSGIITALSGAETKHGFAKNPMSLFFSRRFDHVITSQAGGKHEIYRNHAMIARWAGEIPQNPALYPEKTDYDKVKTHQGIPYITISPASLWFTKQYPEEKWEELIRNISPDLHVILLGSGADQELCSRIAESSGRKAENLAGKLNFLQSAALMQSAVMNYVNDSAPQHLATAVNAPVAAVFCSTVPEFGFGPLSAQSHIIESNEKLNCRPCGLHGHKACPEGHFKCAYNITARQLTEILPDGHNL